MTSHADRALAGGFWRTNSTTTASFTIQAAPAAVAAVTQLGACRIRLWHRTPRATQNQRGGPVGATFVLL
jgi:hypothetical protein